MSIKYNVMIQKEEEWYVAKCLDNNVASQGKTIEEAKKEVGMVIESIDNIEAAYELSKIHNVEMPIVDGVYDILYHGLDPKKAVNMLMTRDKKFE